MITPSGMTRRSFLRTLACLGVIGSPRAAPAWAPTGARRSPDPLAAKLAGLFTHNDGAVPVGREYLRTVPREADAQLLVKLICGSSSSRRVELVAADPERCLEVLVLQQREDFERGRTVKLRGWVLSETEVRLCALAALVLDHSTT